MSFNAFRRSRIADRETFEEILVLCDIGKSADRAGEVTRLGVVERIAHGRLGIVGGHMREFFRPPHQVIGDVALAGNALRGAVIADQPISNVAHSPIFRSFHLGADSLIFANDKYLNQHSLYLTRLQITTDTCYLFFAMRIQSRNKYDDGLDGLDPYFTCPEAIVSLIALEGDRLPDRLWEPAAGDGAIVHSLRQTGRFVVASDIHDYGLEECAISDYLRAAAPPGIGGIVTNPPYKLAMQFAEKALGEVPYLALLVRSNFDIEGVRRMGFRARHPPSRIWRSARRLPMMHRYGWIGNQAPSNTPHCWLVWERGAPRAYPQDFDWRRIVR